MANPVIYAAILAVQHSFIVDNYNCGAPSHAERLRRDRPGLPRYRRHENTDNNGNVSIVSGYDKSYNYDDRLASEEPPYFLNPVSAQWYVARQTECNSATAC